MPVRNSVKRCARRRLLLKSALIAQPPAYAANPDQVPGAGIVADQQVHTCLLSRAGNFQWSLKCVARCTDQYTSPLRFDVGSPER